MSNILQNEYENYQDNDAIEDKCYEELKHFLNEFKKKKLLLNEEYLKNNLNSIIWGEYFIPYPLLVHISKFFDIEKIESDNFFNRNLKLFEKEHTWFGGGMKKICSGINFFADYKDYEYVLLYTVSKFIEWYPEHSDLLIIEEE